MPQPSKVFNLASSRSPTNSGDDLASYTKELIRKNFLKGIDVDRDDVILLSRSPICFFSHRRTLIRAWVSMAVVEHSTYTLHLDIGCGNPPPQPSLIIRLPLPPNRYLRKRRTISSDFETDDDETGPDKVLVSIPCSRTTRSRWGYYEFWIHHFEF